MALKQPFERIDFDEHSGKLKTSCAARIIGASCGAFLFCNPLTGELAQPRQTAANPLYVATVVE